MNANNMTVFIIDDDPAVRDALSLMLEQANLIVKGFGRAHEFLDFYRPDMPGCVVVDINMPGMNGIQLQEELIARGILLPIIFLTGHGNIPLSVKTIKAGASDFLTKPVSCEKLLSSIQTALLECKDLMLHKKINQRNQALLAALTQREHEVMMLALDGQTNKKIAQQLGISHRTVEIHKARLMQKTGAENLLDLAHIVQEAGLTIGHVLQIDQHQP